MPLLSQELRLEFLDSFTKRERSVGNSKSQYPNKTGDPTRGISTGGKGRWQGNIHDPNQHMASPRNDYVQTASSFAKVRVPSKEEAASHGKVYGGLSAVDARSILHDSANDTVQDDQAMMDDHSNDSLWSSLLTQSVFAPDDELKPGSFPLREPRCVSKDSSRGQTRLNKIPGLLGLGKKPHSNSRCDDPSSNHTLETANPESGSLRSESFQANVSLRQSTPSPTNRLTHAQTIPCVLVPGAKSLLIDAYPQRILPAPLHNYVGLAIDAEMNADTPQHIQRDFDAVDHTRYAPLAKRTHYPGPSILDRKGDAWVKWQKKIEGFWSIGMVLAFRWIIKQYI